MNEIIYEKGYEELKNEIREEMSKSVNSFVRIGYLLKVARDTNVLADSQYSNMEEFAYNEFKIDKGTASKFMSINDRFSEGGNSDRLKPEFEGVGWSKLSIMLQLPDSINQELGSGFSKNDIKALRDEVAEAQGETPIETMLDGESKTTAQAQDTLSKAIRQLGESEPDLYLSIHAAVPEDYQYNLGNIKSIMAPAGEKIYSIRIRGVGRIMLSCKDYEETVSMINERTGEKETKLWDDLARAWTQIVKPDTEAKQNWEEIYEMHFPEKEEVAPVQPKKETKVVKVNPKKKKTEKETTKKPKEAVSKTDVQQSLTQRTLHDEEPSIPKPDPIPEPERVAEEDVEVIEPDIPGQDTVENHSEWMPDEQQSEEELKAAVSEELEALNDFWNGQYRRKAELMLGILREMQGNLEKLEKYEEGTEDEV